MLDVLLNALRNAITMVKLSACFLGGYFAF